MTEIEEVKEALDAMLSVHAAVHNRMDLIETAMNRTHLYDLSGQANTGKDAETWARTMKAQAGRDANAFD